MKSPKEHKVESKPMKKVRFSDHIDVRMYSLNNPIVFTKKTPPFASHTTEDGEYIFGPCGWDEFYNPEWFKK